MEHTIRTYDEPRDLDHLVRCWMEVGWIDTADKTQAVAALFRSASVEVAELGGEAEAMTMWNPGRIRYQDTDLVLSVITAVTVSHVARKLGLASELVSRSLQQAADGGAAVAALGMFEQGFYDRFGFGTAAYEHDFTFDPTSLMVDHVPYRRPLRLTADDYADVHSAMVARKRSHGGVTIDTELTVKGEMSLPDHPYTLGYRDDDGTLTHFVFGGMKDEHGPFRVHALGYRSTAQLLELLRMLKELGDQVRSVQMLEPPDVQLQALLREPVRARDRSKGSSHESGNRGGAWMQFRMLDVFACVAARRWPGEPVRFNLRLDDPVAGHLAHGWRGVGGDYTVTIGKQSLATRGHADGLSLLSTGVASFTRLWFGVARASALCSTDPVDAPDELIEQLDNALQLPPPLPGWEF